MLFNSLQYAVFLPIVVALYYLCPARAKIGLLLLASYLFYASWSAVYLALIVGLTILNYLLGILISRYNLQSRTRAVLLCIGVALNLLTLGYYKYIGFLLTNVATAFGWLGVTGTLAPWSPILPLGLSFFIFEFIHYLVDVRNGGSPIRSVVQFAVFAAFFPTQVAGPIKRYEAFLPQMTRPSPFSWGNIGEGLRLLVVGLFKKVAIADNLAPLVQIGFHQIAGGTPPLNPLDAWLAVMAFALQIYFDFSGYTDMGRGSALLLGYRVPENFRRPYLAANISEFWRRWHMSLSTWLRDYVYIPLGGNRGHRERNLLLTMILGGLWHGASWTFVIWGVYHGVLLATYWKLQEWRTRPAQAHSPSRALLMWFATFLLVCVGWVFFRADSFSQAMAMIGSMFGLASGAAPVFQLGQRFLIAMTVASMLTVEWLLERNERRRRSEQLAPPASVSDRGEMILRSLGWTLLFMVTLLAQPTSGPRFIYFQF